MRPYYNAKPIGSLAALSKTLQVDLGILQKISKEIANHYHPHVVPKKNGGDREICIPSNYLKIIQKRINRKIFDNVVYPHYLHGGISERDYVRNAATHSDAEVVISLDLKNFYPNIKINKVEEIFQYFCKFPPPVAKLLSELCCFNGVVPQGGCSSSHLANLILNGTEYKLVSMLESKGYCYTRLLDDISISTKKIINQNEIEKIILAVKADLKKCDLKLNNRKQKITSKSNPEDLMEVTGLWLNRGRPKAHKSDRRLIRAEVHRCEKEAAVSRYSDSYHALHNSVSGKVAKLAYLKHPEAEIFRKILRSILPLYDVSATASIFKQATYLSKSKIDYRSKFVYFQKYYKVQYKLNILMRSDKSKAIEIKRVLKNCQPLGRKDDLLYNESI
ncbi:reverse transcriptase family protein [Comamonas sp. 23]|uniref:reverse transcriptase family protein n=1 Tax=Comamonas sp. 23 TaxID=3415008 RepID=UPI003C6F9D78